MILSLEEIRKAVTDKTIAAITLDTSVFDANGLGLEYGRLKRMSQFKGSGTTFVLSDVIAGELGSHLSRKAASAAAGLKKSLKEFGDAWQRDKQQREQVTGILIGGDDAQAISTRRVANFVSSSGALIVKADDHVAISDLLARYFQTLPPFAESGAKKHEFPDALALLSLENWANKNNTLLLCVSLDPDWKRFCDDSKSLVCIADFTEALGCFQEETIAHFCISLTEEINETDVRAVLAAIQTKLNSEPERLTFLVQADSQFQYDEDEIEAAYRGAALSVIEGESAFAPVESSEGRIVVQGFITVTAEINAHFSFNHWDSIDRDYVPMGTASCGLEKEIEVEVLLTFVGTLPDAMELAEVEILSSTQTINLGEIEPDWMNDPDNFGS